MLTTILSTSFKSPVFIIKKKAKAAGDLIGNKIPDKKSQNNSETVINEKEISKERYISSDESQKIVDDLILI